jgi:small subunit ribosomal protein S1
VDPSKEKLSLSLKRVGTSPWAIVKTNHPVGSRVKGPVTHLTPFGAFVMLPEGIEGLIHVSDLSWAQKISHPSAVVTVGQDVEVVVMDVKVEAEKIVLSLKHTLPDPLSSFRNGQTVQGSVTAASDDGVKMNLGNGLEGFVRRQEMPEDIDGRAQTPTIGSEVGAKVLRIDFRERQVELSIRRYDRDEERRMLKQYSGRNQEPLTLGDVLLDTSETADEASE